MLGGTMFACKKEGRAPVGDPAATRPRRRAAQVRWSLSFAAAAALAGALMLPQAALAATGAPAVTFTKLTLLHGWKTSPYNSATPAVTKISGIVYFKGAISTTKSNTNLVAFVLPQGFRPSKTVNVPVDMCSSKSGELNIAPDGVTQVISAGATTTATCFSSLDGASFAQSPASFTKLKLAPGWKEFGSFYMNAAARLSGGIVQFEGMIQTKGTNRVAFTLPAGLRPSRNVYALISLCTGSIGRLDITPSGVVSVEAEGTGNWWMAQCATSLDGASFALPPTSFTGLTLHNGWMNAPYGAAKAAVRNISGIVHFRGAIWTMGTNPDPFILPAQFRPAKTVYIPADLCNGNNGRLVIQPDGAVVVQAENEDFAQAACFTSLDGVSFAR
jgi:hypothetical protein